MENILTVKNLVKHYGDVAAVNGISFEIEKGTCFGLLGPNGAGKTTTIEVIEGITPIDRGEILFMGEPRKKHFNERIGVQFQNTALPAHLTVKETLSTFRNLYTHRADFNTLVETCRLEDILGRDNRKISGGQKQRLLLALALANDPELIFLDEPTTGLDPQARRHLWDIVEDIKKSGKTIVLTTHYMDEAEILCDNIAIMDIGKIIAMGTPQELLKKHCTSSTIILRGAQDEEALDRLALKWYRIEDQFEIEADNLNESIEMLIQHGFDLSDLTVRSGNLEDLFLMLTGKHLRS